MRTPLQICHACMPPDHKRACSGRCPCPYDPAGADIIEHAKVLECPEGYFTANGPTGKARIIVRSSAVPASPPKPVEPLPRSEWPWQIKALSLAANDADTGIGDVVQRLAAALGGEQFKAAYKAVVGMPCGCNSRRDWLNRRFPLA